MQIFGVFVLMGLGFRWYSNGLNVLATRLNPDNLPTVNNWVDVFMVITWPVWLTLGLMAGVAEDVENLGRWIRGQDRHDP